MPTTEPKKRLFLESLPAGLSGSQILAHAKNAGVDISPSYAYHFARSRKLGRRTPGNAERRVPGRPSGAADSAESRFLALALELGLRRSEQLLGRLRAKAQALAYKSEHRSAGPPPTFRTRQQ